MLYLFTKTYFRCFSLLTVLVLIFLLNSCTNISIEFPCIAFVVTEIVNQIGSDGFGAFAHYVRSAYGTGQNSLLNINVSGELSSSTAGQFGVIEDVEGYSLLERYGSTLILKGARRIAFMQQLFMR